MAKKDPARKKAKRAKAAKAVKKAIQDEANSSVANQKWLASVTAEIVASPISDGYKAFFLYTIAQGTFSDELHKMFLKLLSDYRQELEEKSKSIEQELAELEEEQARVEAELTQAAIGACKEIEVAVEHIEHKTERELERRAGHKEASAIEEIQQKLKKK